MLSISKLSVSVDSKKILSDISFDVNNREIIAIIGPNGAGKSTLLKSILGLYPKYQGKILLNQNQITSLKINDKAKQMAYLSQSVSLSFNFLAEEVIEFGIYSYRKKIKNHLIKQKIKDMMQLTDTGHLIKRDYFSLLGGGCTSAGCCSGSDRSESSGTN